jgi:hypothetical protein
MLTVRKAFIVFAVLAVAASAVGIYWLFGPDTFYHKKPSMQTVYLFYYNKARDTDAGGQILCSPESVLPVKRMVPESAGKKQILELLLEGELTQEEKAAGFETEFPNPEFRLVKMDFNEHNGCLTLWFNPVQGFTTGGSCRTGLLYAQIRKTAASLPGVREVEIQPDTLFQP